MVITTAITIVTIIIRRWDPDKYTIMGANTVTVDQMVRYYKARASYPDFYGNTEASTIEKFCQI